MPGALQRAWKRRGAPARLLWPLSLAYGALAALHRAAYAAGLLRTERLPVPVVVVGNVVAGGAGKTPVVVALVEHLRARGLQPGVIARGYGRRGSGCIEVHAESDPLLAGDEPLLVRRKTGAPVFVAARRADAARALLQAHPGTQVIVSDDGLQHHPLGRDIAICVFDGRGVGNGWLLPAGPLRERWPRRVDLVLHHGHPPGIAGHPMERSLAGAATRADGARLTIAQLRSRRVTAVAGIAQPEAFFDALRALGIAPVAAIPLPDHHDFHRLVPGLDRADTVLCTEKDAVKLWRQFPQAWALPLEVQIPAAFWQAFDALLDAKLSSPHGPETP